MLTFFRRIRKGLLGTGATRPNGSSPPERLSRAGGRARKPATPTGRYLVYAAGEVLLVMVGILLALQVNNWNESRIEQQIVQNHAVSLIHDLEQDIIMINFILIKYTELISRIDNFAEYTQNKNIDELDNLKVFCYTLNTPLRPYLWNRTTLEEMKNSGSLQYIKAPIISKMLAKYDAFTHHLDEDYINDKTQLEKAMYVMGNIVNMNYSNFDELKDMLLPLPPNENKDYLYTETKEYQDAKELNLLLLTSDIKDITRFVNNLNTLKMSLEIRIKNELPRLKGEATSLVELLEDNYISS